VAALAGALGATGCGSDSKSDSGGGASADAAPAADNSASLARAKEAIAPFTGKPSAFPLETPLSKRPAGETVAFMDCGTPVCGLFRDLATAGAQVMGIKLKVVKTGQSADSINAAFSSIVESKPAAVINTANDPVTWQKPLEDLKAAGIPITNTGIINGADFGLTTDPNSVMFGKDSSDQIGKLLADWVYVKYGADSNAAFYYAPELNFMAVIRDSFTNEMKELCPDCTVRAVKIPVTSFGNSAPQKIVSDLQAKPDTKVAVAANSEIFIGLPAALKTAGITVDTVGTGGGPVNLQYVKDGQQTVDLALDLPVLSWTLVDAAVRPIVGDKVPPEEAKGLPPLQFLTKDDIKFDPSKGWTGYPDFGQRFAKLWGAG
jgi:ribose transport system substrate-binding protein